jgi:RNA polymerase sigma-70 factor (ECF subfamily)
MENAMLPEEFAALAASLRPSLHRYCARMLGSAFDGEDVVQDAMAKAIEAFPTADVERPRPWLFRIAHNAALDALRRRKRQDSGRAEVDLGTVVDETAAADARIAAGASLAAFMPLSATERSSVILVDVLGDSLNETAEMLGVSLAAVKAALHRGRARLKAVATAVMPGVPVVTAEEKARLRAYVDRFNARDFDALRDLLAEDATLDLVNRTRLAGRKDVAIYFHRYEERSDWRFLPVLADGRPALLGVDPDGGDEKWLVLLDWRDDRIMAIQDFKFAAYVTEAVNLSPL